MEKSISRRGFVMAAGAVGAMATLPVIARAADVTWDDEADVVVCGVGTAGAPAAITAAENGSDVYMFEKRDWIGGCLRRCGGGFMAAGTSVQEKLGIDDDPSMMAEYLIALAGDYGDADVINAYCENAAPTFEWIIAPESEGGLGGEPLDEWEFSKKGPDEYWIGPGLNIGGTPVYYDDLGLSDDYRPRCHWFKPNLDDVDPGDRLYAFYSEGDSAYGEPQGGTGLWKPFADRLDKLGIRIDTQTELVGLVQDEDTGEIRGVICSQGGITKTVKSRQGVMLATGGFANDQDCYETFTGQQYAEPTAQQSETGGYIAGQADGAAIKAGMAAGAALAFPVLGNNGGLRINKNAQVMGWDGEPIPRLYAAGRAAGGYAGNSYPSCGFYVGTGITFGRIAGRQLAGLDGWE
ncbi:FAD-binding protein [bacterium]|nr:FAD-binding protein [bacterium]